MDAAAHRKISDAIDDRLTRVEAVFARVAGQKFDLNVLTFCHYILSAIPDAAFIELHVSDQGGDDMTFQSVGVRQDRSSAVQDSDLPVDLVEIDGVEYVLMDTTCDIFLALNEDGSAVLTEDSVCDYAMSLQDYELRFQPFWEPIGSRKSGMGRLWIGRALETFERTYEGFIKGTLDPMPDPEDKVALAEWLASETAPTEEEPLCGCGGRHAVHPD